jgi:hypothetical protein
MDYSLLLIKAESPILDLDLKYKSKFIYKSNECGSNGMQVYYFIGLIDYLQKYNCSKKFEKLCKRFLKFKLKLDTSSQNPNKYQIRFINKMEEIFILKHPDF